MKHRLTSLALLGLVALAAGWSDPPSPSDDAPAGTAADAEELLASDDLDDDGPGGDPLEGGDGGQGGASILGGAGVAPGGVCTGRRWISRAEPSSNVPCAAAAGFDAEPLFPSNGPLPTELAGYCLHTWTGADDPSAQDVSGWKKSVGTADLAEDCALVTPLGTYEDHLAAMLRGAVTSRIGIVNGPAHDVPPVHVAVIDTTPDAPAGASVLGDNRHGDTLAALIGDVVQVPGAAAISTSLALPRATDPGTGVAVYKPTGGDFGYLSDLARAVWRAFVDHRDKHASERLVLNLSLGWDPSGESSKCGGNMLPAARAVRDVLDVAACEAGALIVAAAGNDMGGPTPGGGLMCPAAFMTQTPSCDPDRPLVVGAYGLDHADAPLAIARPGSSTPFAAPGLGGIAWPAGAPRPAPLTGTSVSAAAVTASIAAVWAASPALAPAEVITLLHEHAMPLGAPADTCAPGVPGCDVRRISPCGALSAIGSPWSCLASAAPTLVSNPDLDPATHADLLTNLTSAGTVLAADHPGLLPSEIAPAAGGQGTVSPQPIIPVCPTCAVALCPGTTSSNPVFYGSLGRSVSSLVLVVNGPTSTSRYSISVSSSTTSFGAILPVSASAARSAWISATDATTGLSILEQVLVAP